MLTLHPPAGGDRRARTHRWRRAFDPALALAILAIAALAACERQPSKDVVARINGKQILRSELEKYYRGQTAGAPQQPAEPMSREQSDILRLNILKDLIDNEIVMQHAEKLGLLATDDEVNAKLNEVKSPYSAEDFKKRLQERSLSEDDFKRDLRRTLTVQKLLNKEISSKISVSDQDVTAYYNAHKVLVDDAAVRSARLRLIDAVRQVIANALGLLGIRAPNAM